MIREEYFRRLVDAAHVDLYLSATDGARLYWPWRMQPPKEATTSYRNACECYIIDSDPLNDSVGVRDVLDCAARFGAEVASLVDVYQDKTATVKSLLDGLSVADDHRYDGQLLLPLQAPYVECWRELGEPTDWWLGIGGLKDAPDADRMRAVTSLREAIPPDTHLHGFGWGVSDRLAAFIRDRPDALDSLDYSTPVQNNVDGVTPGDERMSVTAANAGAKLIRDLREVTDHPDSGSTDIQTGLANW